MIQQTQRNGDEIKFIVVNQNGSLIEKKSKSGYVSDLKEAHIIIGKNKLHVVWKYQNWNIGLFGNTTAHHEKINKYEFPPPVENILFKGNCILVNLQTKQDGSLNYKQFNDLTLNEWTIIYNKLYGGFESLSSSDTDDSFSDDSNNNDDIKEKKFSNGYLVDDFVVDDDYISSSSSDEE